MNNIFNKVKQNPFLLFIIAFTIIVFIIAIIALIFTSPKDNHKLSSDEKIIQSTIQRETRNNDVRLNDILVEDGGWKLVQINNIGDRSNYAMVIINNENVVLGPGSNFTIDDLMIANVPEKIISYLYPEKPYWINFDDSFNTSLKYNNIEIKGFIQSWAVANNINLTYVTMNSSVDRNTYNPNDDNRAEVLKFNFTINNSVENYTFVSTYLVITAQYTYQIYDSNDQLLFQSQFNS